MLKPISQNRIPGETINVQTFRILMRQQVSLARGDWLHRFAGTVTVKNGTGDTILPASPGALFTYTGARRERAFQLRGKRESRVSGIRAVDYSSLADGDVDTAQHGRSIERRVF